MARIDCISDRDLQAFVRGDLPERLTERVARHLELCPECEERASRWDNLPDTAVQALRRPAQDRTADDQTDVAPGPGRPDTEAVPQPIDRLSSPDGYTLLHELGRGASGVVFQARQHHPERVVALKFFSAGVHAAEEKVRFLAEANIIARLDHPNIVRVHAVGEHQGQPFLCLEYLEGGHLGKKINGQPQPPRQAARLLEQLARAVQHAHEKGIIHRDLKPANVLLTGDGTPKVSDFGLARFGRPELTATGAVMGTPAYMAPEQARGEGKIVGPAADIWALGVILYELLTGQPPFRGVQVLDTLQQVVEREPVPPRRLQPQVPRDLETICLKCLQKRPPRRYGTATALADDLKRYLDGRPIQARPVGNLERVAKWARRRPGAAALVALLLLMVCATVGTAFWFQQYRADREKEQLQYQAEEGRRRTEDIQRDVERKLRHLRSEQGIAAALKQSQQLQEGLHTRLAQPGGVARLLNQPGEWQQLIATAQANLKTARELQAGAEGQISEELNRQLTQLEKSLHQDEADRKLALRLEKIREDRTTAVEGKLQFALALREYPIAFAEAGLAVPEEDAQLESLSARIRKSAIKQQMVATLDDWAFAALARNVQLRDACRGELARLALQGSPDYLARFALVVRLERLAQLTDPDPWRDQIRAPVFWADVQSRKTLVRKLLANKTALAQLSPQMLALVGNLLPADKEGEEWLRRVQAAHPTDFWLCFSLAQELHTAKSAEAIGYYRAALAVRPQSAGAWNNLGIALRDQKDLAGSLYAFEKVVAINPEDASAWMNLGNSRRDQTDLLGALAAQKRALELNPQYAPAWDSLGAVLADQKNLTKAVTAYKKALAINRDFVHAWRHLGYALALQNNLAEAVDAYQRAVAIDPSDAPTWNFLGLVLAARNHLPQAADAYRKALKLNPHDAAVWTNLGVALAAQKNLPEAIAAYRKALAINPKHASAWDSLGLALGCQNDLPGALAAHKEAVSLDPQSFLAWTNLGNVMMNTKDRSGAVDAFTKALKINSQFIPAWNNLGTVRKQQNDLPAAERCFRKILDVDPQNVAAWSNLAHVRLAQRDWKKAEEYCRKALDIDPKLAEPWTNLGVALAYQKGFSEADQCLRRAVNLAPDNAEIWSIHGWVLKEWRHFPDAEKSYRRAVELDPSAAATWNMLGEMQRQQGKGKEGEESYRRALKLNPKFSPSWNNLGLVLMARKDYAGAEECFLKALQFDPRHLAAQGNLLLVRTLKNFK
jgi:serine/threonine-protein kinase